MVSALLLTTLGHSVPIQSNAPIAVPFHQAEDAIIVDAVVNGRPVSLMFDSGFSGYIVLGSHVNVGPASGTMTLRDFVGTFQAKTVKLNTLQLGGHTLKPENAEIVQQGEDYSLQYGVRCDGIMGLAALKGQPLEINFEKGQFIFHPASLDIRNRTADNQKTFLTRMLPAGNDSIELRVETANGERMNLALDTGNAFYATTHKDVLVRTGLWKQGETPKFLSTSYVASGPVVSWNIMIKDAKIFGVPVNESVWNIIDLPSSSAEGDGTVGFQFLKHFNMVIDLDRRHVWLENFAGRVTDEAEGDVGIFAFYDRNKKRAVVWNVMPNSPAAEAGIQRGDQILGIDARDITTLGWRQINAMLKGKPDTPIKLDVSRNGAFSRYELNRKLLFNVTLN